MGAAVPVRETVSGSIAAIRPAIRPRASTGGSPQNPSSPSCAKTSGSGAEHITVGRPVGIHELALGCKSSDQGRSRCGHHTCHCVAADPGRRTHFQAGNRAASGAGPRGAEPAGCRTDRTRGRRRWSTAPRTAAVRGCRLPAAAPTCKPYVVARCSLFAAPYAPLRCAAWLARAPALLPQQLAGLLATIHGVTPATSPELPLDDLDPLVAVESWLRPLPETHPALTLALRWLDLNYICT